jgi:hypothetical protein
LLFLLFFLSLFPPVLSVLSLFPPVFSRKSKGPGDESNLEFCNTLSQTAATDTLTGRKLEDTLLKPQSPCVALLACPPEGLGSCRPRHQDLSGRGQRKSDGRASRRPAAARKRGGERDGGREKKRKDTQTANENEMRRDAHLGRYLEAPVT